MSVSAIDTGYLGLVTGACLAEMGNQVVCLDIGERNGKILSEGDARIHERSVVRAAMGIEYSAVERFDSAHSTLAASAVAA